MLSNHLTTKLSLYVKAQIVFVEKQDQLAQFISLLEVEFVLHRQVVGGLLWCMWLGTFFLKASFWELVLGF